MRSRGLRDQSELALWLSFSWCPGPTGGEGACDGPPLFQLRCGFYGAFAEPPASGAGTVTCGRNTTNGNARTRKPAAALRGGLIGSSPKPLPKVCGVSSCIIDQVILINQAAKTAQAYLRLAGMFAKGSDAGIRARSRTRKPGRPACSAGRDQLERDRHRSVHDRYGSWRSSRTDETRHWAAAGNSLLPKEGPRRV